MKTSILRKAFWIADAALAVLLVALSVRALSGTPQVTPDNGPLPGPEASAAALRGVTDEEAAQITRGGVIVPAPRAASGPIAAQPTVAPGESNPFSNFRYRCIGTAVGSTSYAWFEDSSSLVQTGRAEGGMLGDAKVVKILEDRVLLQIGGQAGYIERVKPARAQTTAAQPASRQAAPVVPMQAARTGEGDTGEEEEDEWFEDPDQLIMTDAKFKEYVTNAGHYIAQLSIQSHTGPDNKIDGLLLARVPKESEAYKRGFREGDIVTHIQGEPITDTSAAFKAANEVLKNEDYVIDVTFMRDGREETLTYEIWPE